MDSRLDRRPCSWEISEQFGYEGVLISEGWSNRYLEERVSLDAFQGRLYHGYGVDGAEPSYSRVLTRLLSDGLKKMGQMIGRYTLALPTRCLLGWRRATQKRLDLRRGVACCAHFY